jgi:hypothetical protein
MPVPARNALSAGGDRAGAACAGLLDADYDHILPNQYL